MTVRANPFGAVVTPLTMVAGLTHVAGELR